MKDNFTKKDLIMEMEKRHREHRMHHQKNYGHHRKHNMHHREFHKEMVDRKLNELFFLHKYMKIFRKITLIVSIVIILFLLKVIGFKMATWIIILVLIINEGTIVYMISRMEKRFVKPMEKLQSGVRKIADGDYTVRLETDTRNEIGILTREFNKMASKLEEGEKIKKEYEENRKALLANVSHDLKTPITCINGYVEGLLENVVSKDNVDNYLKVIKSNAEYMNRLIDDLFLFSKLDMQKLDFKFEKTNIKLYLNDIVEEFSFILDEKEIKFSYEESIDTETFVNIDGKRLYRSIRNILDNAIKYGLDKENLKIEMMLYKDKDSIFIGIEDNGFGIEKDKVDKIFQRFYRVDKERTKDLNSTWLGLAITKEIVDAHKGEIYVSSEVNIGTNFTIRLPIFKEDKNNGE